MATMAPSSSFAPELGAYLRGRVLNRRVLLLVAVVSGAILAASGPMSMAGTAMVPVLTAVLVAQLRLWDDLADRDYDRTHHPDRLLVRSPHGQAYCILLVASILLVAAALLLHGPPRGLPAYAFLVGMLALLYHTSAGARLPRPLRVSVVLTKYPLLVPVVAAGGLAAHAIWPALALYGLLVAFEWRDDPRLRSNATLTGAAAGWSLGAVIVLAVFLVQ